MPLTTTILKKIYQRYQTSFNIEIQFEMLFRIYQIDQIKLAPYQLICLLDYDKDHSKTKLYLKCLSESFSLTCGELLNMVSSKNTSKIFCTHTFKNKISDILRHSKCFTKLSRTLCSVFEKNGCIYRSQYYEIQIHFIDLLQWFTRAQHMYCKFKFLIQMSRVFYILIQRMC